MAVTATPAKKRQKHEKFSDRCKAAFAKFAAEPAMPDQAAPPPAGVTHDDLVAMLTEMGFDPAMLDTIKDDNALAEIIRVCKSQAAAMAEAKPPQPGTTNADTPAITPVPAPAPAPAPAAVGIPGVTGQPTQVTLKFGEKNVDLNEVLKPLIDQAVAAAVKPINDGLAAAGQAVDKFQESQKKNQIDAKLDLLLKQGKVLPAEIDSANPDNLRNQLYRANGVHKFSDGKTELDKQIALLEARPQILKMSEQVKGGKTGGADTEVQKVEAFCESAEFSTAAKAVGKKPADYVAAFKAAQAKNPALTAKDFGVPASYAN